MPSCMHISLSKCFCHCHLTFNGETLSGDLLCLIVVLPQDKNFVLTKKTDQYQALVSCNAFCILGTGPLETKRLQMNFRLLEECEICTRQSSLCLCFLSALSKEKAFTCYDTAVSFAQSCYTSQRLFYVSNFDHYLQSLIIFCLQLKLSGKVLSVSIFGLGGIGKRIRLIFKRLSSLYLWSLVFSQKWLWV